MKILHLNDTYHARGGVEQYLLRTMAMLTEDGHRNAVIYLRDDPRTIRNGRWPAYLVSGTEQQAQALVRDVVEREQPDVAYVHQVLQPAILVAVSRLVPTVAYVHGFAPVCPGLGKYFRRGDRVCRLPFGWACLPMHYLQRCSDARNPQTICRLMVQAAKLNKAYQLVSRSFVATRYMKAVLVQNGFDPDHISVMAPYFLPERGLPEFRSPGSPEQVLFAGRLEMEKGLPYLLRALSRLRPSTTLLVAGDGTQRPAYERMAARLGLAGRVRFAGWLDQRRLSSAYQRCSLLAMPSVCPEPFGRAGIEALAYGRPTVAFDVGGVSDWLDDGTTGLLATPGDVHDLADKMAALLPDEQRLAAMGRAARIMVAERFSATEHRATLLAAFESARAHHAPT